MKKISLLIAVLVMCITVIKSDNVAAQTWPQWRGPLNNGAAPAGNPPVEWNEQLNVKWKVPINGEGQSTPAVWRDYIFLTSSVAIKDSTSEDIDFISKPIKFFVTALDRTTGKVKWEKLANEEIPNDGKHFEGTWAAASPITDGKHVYAYFGSRGLYCYTIDGDLVWKKDLGDQFKRSSIGEGDSPALYKDKIIVNWDHEKDSFIVALNAATGKELWRKARNQKSTWMTPLIVEDNGLVHVIVTAMKRVLSYNIENGEIIWEAKGTLNSYCMPAASDGVVYFFSRLSGKKALNALLLKNAKGRIESAADLLWSLRWSVNNISSPLIQDNLIYLLKGDKGMLSCIDASDGTEYYSSKRLTGIKQVYASPTGVADRMYILGRKGAAVVVSQGREFEILAENALDDHFDASPVVVGEELYLRGQKFLYRISK